MSHLVCRLGSGIVWVGLGLGLALSASADTRHPNARNGEHFLDTPQQDGASHLPLQFETRQQPATSPPAASLTSGGQAAEQTTFPRASSYTEQEAITPFPPRSSNVRPDTASFVPRSAGKTMTTVVASLGLVLVVFFVFVWATRKTAPQGMTQLPSEVVETLGRTPLAARQQLHLVRVGSKLVLLSVTATETRAVTEITDAAEVDRLAGLCQQNRPGSATASFRQTLTEAARPVRDPARRQPTSRRAGGRLHA